MGTWDRVSPHRWGWPGSAECNLPVCGLCPSDHSLFKAPALTTSLFRGVWPPPDWVPSPSKVHLLLLAAHPTPGSFPPDTLLSNSSLFKNLASTAPSAGLAPGAGMWLVVDLLSMLVARGSVSSAAQMRLRTREAVWQPEPPGSTFSSHPGSAKAAISVPCTGRRRCRGIFPYGTILFPKMLCLSHPELPKPRPMEPFSRLPS